MTVALFATCLVDLWRPQVGFAAARLLEAGGAHVVVPAGQSCCGQPAYNSGDRAAARALARHTVAALEGFDAVVVPSGSCAGMLANHYPALLADDGAAWQQRAAALAAQTWELTAYCHDVLGMTTPPGNWHGTATYHDSCSCLRELDVAAAPRALLSGLGGLRLTEADGREVCCGFGGTFAVKYADIAARMADDKADALEATGAQTVLAADLGCLLHLAGRLRRRGSALACRHVAELLADTDPGPPIGAGADRPAGNPP